MVHGLFEGKDKESTKNLSLIISGAIRQYNHISRTCQICEQEMTSGRRDMQTWNRNKGLCMFRTVHKMFMTFSCYRHIICRSSCYNNDAGRDLFLLFIYFFFIFRHRDHSESLLSSGSGAFFLPFFQGIAQYNIHLR